MPDRHLPLEWLARRRDGESIALIAWRDEVPPQLVRRATERFGPFPRATQHLGRTQMLSEVAGERTRRWIRARQRGQRVMQIAADDGVSHQLVSEATVEHGPFPSEEVVREWVEARHAGHPAATIAAEYRTTTHKVRRATRPFGPFRSRGPAVPDGLLGIQRISERLGVSTAAVQGWAREGLLPPPDFVTARGRRIWQERTIEQWLSGQDLERCPACGALALNVRQHSALAHRATRSAGPGGSG